MNKNSFLSVLVAHGENQGDMAKMLGVSRVTLSRKINEYGTAAFTQPEMAKIKKHYGLSDEEMGAIFFAD